jgi:hypothetical protein
VLEVVGDLCGGLGELRVSQHPAGAVTHDLIDQRRGHASTARGSVVIEAVGVLGNYSEHGSYLPDRRWRAGLS